MTDNRVIFLSVCDWANVGYGLAESLKAVGVRAVAYAFGRHPFAYPQTDTPAPERDRLMAEIESADLTVFMHSTFPFKSWDDLPKARYGVFHGGSAYREGHQAVNELFNPHVDISLIQTSDLRGLGAKNEHGWILPAINTDLLQPQYREDETAPVVFGHFPSNPTMKGSGIVNAVMARITDHPDFRDKMEYRYSHRQLPWEKSIERMMGADIVIEHMARTVNGRPIFGWGVTAMEAAALGKIVFIRESAAYMEYMAEFGVYPALYEMRDDMELMRWIKKFSARRSGRQDWNQVIRETQRHHREWVTAYHSYAATGRRLKEILL